MDKVTESIIREIAEKQEDESDKKILLELCAILSSLNALTYSMQVHGYAIVKEDQRKREEATGEGENG